MLFQSGRVALGIPGDDTKHASFVESFMANPGAVVLSGDAANRAEALAAELGLVEVVSAPEGRVLVPETRLEDPRR